MANKGEMKNCALLANWGVGAALLKALLEREGVSVRFVVTTWDDDATDPWRNAVRDLARENGIPCHPERLPFGELSELIRAGEIDLLLVHAGRRILPEEVFAAPRRGSINFHPSLLPRHRGAAPNYWVLKNRESRTGMTSHVIDAGMDTGPIIAQVPVPVEPDDTLAGIVEKLKLLVPDLLRVTLERLDHPAFTPEMQDENMATYDPRPPKNQETLA